jgi:hypothetical protein
MKKALIYNGAIVDVAPQEFSVASGFAWVDCPDECKAREWQYVLGACVPPTAPSLADLKASKLLRIKADRAKAAVADVTANGKTWQAGQIDQWLLSNAIARAKRGKNLPDVWRTKGDENVAINNVKQLEDIEDAIVAQVEAAYATSWAREAALKAAQTAEEVDAV